MNLKKILKIASDFYKNLFRHENRPDIQLTDSFFSEEEKVSRSLNDILEAPFSEPEIKKAVFESYSDGAPGPDGLSFMFYQKFWEEVKGDLLEMFQTFHKAELDIYRINFALITLVPKENGACTMNKFRPISLLNCSYKLFTKVLTNRMNLVVDRLISSNRTAFIKGRYILESVVTAHEVIHSVHEKKCSGIVLKLDYEKAYDKVNWDFLLQILEKKRVWRDLD